MTKEDKDLLLKDLCARLQYGVKIQRNNVYDASIKKVESLTIEFLYENENHDLIESLEVKPYLRTMSSMTEEEKKEYTSYVFEQPFLQKDKNPNLGSVPMCIDWLLAHHFDYRGLIPMGLALEAKEGMYKNE